MRIGPTTTLRTQLLLHRRPMAASGTAAGSGASAEFAGAQQLGQWLAAHGVPVDDYGRNSAKSVADLWEEVAAGEAQLCLVDGAPQRQVAVVALAITNEAGEVLREAWQVLPDGRVRERRLPLCEKLLAGEGWQTAAARGVGEELGSVLPVAWRQQWSLDEARYACSTKSMASPSYPGLVTRYTLHRAPARVPGLPRGPFRTEEQRRGGLLVTLWEWAPAHELADAL